MVILLFFCIIVILVFIFGIIKNCTIHNQTIEKFNEEMYIDMTTNDKKIYFKIIDIFNNILKRSPSIDELYIEFKKITKNNESIDNLHNKLKKSEEYKNIVDGNEYYESYEKIKTKTKKNADSLDEQSIKKILQDIMPLLDLDDLYDKKHISFLIMKYRSMNKNVNEFKNYILSTPEYSDYCKIYDKRDFSTDTLNKNAPLAIETKSNSENVDDNDNENVDEEDTYVDEEDTYVVPILASSISSTPLSFNINRPNINNRKKISIKKECKFNDEFNDILIEGGDSLAKRQIKRNMDELMFHCHKEGSGCELNYKNEDIN